MVQLLWIIVCLLLDFTEGYKETNNSEGWTPITDPRQKFLKLQNVSLLITYANNMFGPSTKVKKNKGSVYAFNYRFSFWSNITETLFVRGYALKSPNLHRIKFEPPATTNLERTTKSRRPFQEQRAKRGVLHLYNMVSCATSCNPLIYKGYGCYCGFLGSGYAVDGIDRCCKMHDKCYDTAKCPTFLEYIVPYFWKCYYNRPLCAIDHGEFGGPGSCASRLCECDRVLSECLSHYPCPSSRALCRSSPLRLLQNALMLYP